jgi:uncharacterized Zn finger protein
MIELTKAHRFTDDRRLPQRCPQCGSHRTRVVGQPSDAALEYVRCADCGGTATVVVDVRRD